MTSRCEQYEARKRAWVARQLESCPPLTDRQKVVLQAALAGARVAGREVA